MSVEFHLGTNENSLILVATNTELLNKIKPVEVYT